MANYKETAVAGTEWQRGRLVQINNQRNATPEITFVEERVTVLGDGRSISSDVSQLTEKFDPAATFDLYDPDTLEPTGETATHAELYNLLFGVYMTLAKKRDEPEPEPEPEPEEPVTE